MAEIDHKKLDSVAFFAYKIYMNLEEHVCFDIQSPEPVSGSSETKELYKKFRNYVRQGNCYYKHTKESFRIEGKILHLKKFPLVFRCYAKFVENIKDKAEIYTAIVQERDCERIIKRLKKNCAVAGTYSYCAESGLFQFEPFVYTATKMLAERIVDYLKDPFVELGLLQDQIAEGKSGKFLVYPKKFDVMPEHFDVLIKMIRVFIPDAIILKDPQSQKYLAAKYTNYI